MSKVNVSEQVILRDGDVLVTDSIYMVIASGMIVCDLVTGKYKLGNETVINNVTYEEVCGRHDDGKTVCELSDALRIVTGKQSFPMRLPCK